MTQLYILAEQHRALAEKLADMELDEATIADTLEAESGEIEQKIIAVAAMIRNLESDAEQIKQAAQQMLDRAKPMQARAERLKEYLKTCMTTANVAKAPCPWFVVTLAKNPAAVSVTDESLIPADYFKTIPASRQLDKSSVAAAIKAGTTVPGASLVSGMSVRIK